MFMSRNHRKSRLYSICSHSIRSLRTVYSAISSVAFNSRSGGIEGRPTELYICSNTGDSVRSASSARIFTCLSGWSSGTLFSGVTRLSIVPCFVSLPLTKPEDHAHAVLSIPRVGFFSSLLSLQPTAGVGARPNAGARAGAPSARRSPRRTRSLAPTQRPAAAPIEELRRGVCTNKRGFREKGRRHLRGCACPRSATPDRQRRAAPRDETVYIPFCR